MEIFLTNLRNRLRAYMEQSQTSQNALAKKSKVQQTGLSRFLAEKSILNLDTAVKLTRFLGGKVIFPGDAVPTSPTPSDVEKDKRRIKELEAQVKVLTEENHDLKVKADTLAEALRITASAKRESVVIEEPKKVADG
nr:MAG TPA: Helix-turn-helix XRE-family like protein [Caudoviricetes sp.]